MLQGYSLAAVASILTVVVKACLHGQAGEERPETRDEFREASKVLEAALTHGLAQWEQEIVPTTNPTYQQEFGELRWIVEQTLAHLVSFGPTPPRAN